MPFKGIRKVARKGLKEIPVVGSLIDPIMSLFKRSDEEKLREWAYMDKLAKERLTPAEYKRYKAGDMRKLGSGIPIPFPFVDLKKAWDVIFKP